MRKIAFLDSGVGGLTVLEQFCKQKLSSVAMPDPSDHISDVYYLADLHNLPYGTKSHQQLLYILRQNLHWCVRQGVDTVVLACNTTSALVDQTIRDEFSSISIYTMLDALRDHLSPVGAEHDITGLVIFCTQAAHDAGSHRRVAAEALHPRAQVTSVPCPDLVPFVEGNLTDLDVHRAAALIRQYAQPHVDCPVAVLGCTHYVLLRDVFSQVMPNTTLMDPGQLLATQMARLNIDKSAYWAYTTETDTSALTEKLSALNPYLTCVQRFVHQVMSAEII